MEDKPDKLIVHGIPGLDGEYRCDLVGMNTIGDPECLTNREGYRVKELAGVRAAEILDEFARGDSGVQVALATVVLERHGRRVDVDALWDAPIESGVTFEIGKRSEGDDADPPAAAPPQDEPKSDKPETSKSGGDDSE